MSSNIVPLFKPAPPPDEPLNMSGQAFCIACAHTWAAVAQVGATELECPNCFTHKGKFKFECTPAPGTDIRQCKCGNELFYLTRDGHLCANCGTYQIYT